MFNTRWRKIIGDISSRKTRTFLVSASIFIGVLGVIALFTTRNLIINQLKEDVRLDKLAMIDVEVRVNEGTELDNQLYLETLNQQNEAGQSMTALNGIEVVEGRAFYPIAWAKPGDSEFTEGELRSYSAPLQEVLIEPMRLSEGAWPEPGQNQVAVEQRFADANDFKVGDEIIFNALQDGVVTQVTYTITGFVFHPYVYRGLTGEFPGPELGIYAQYEDSQSLLEFTGFSRIVARYDNFELVEENFDDFVNALISISPYIPVFPTFENPEDNIQVQDAAIFNDILTVLAVVTMIVSSFLVINVISTIVFEQKRQIGAMKAIGATEADSFMMYTGIAFVYGLIGTSLAIIPGIITGYGMTVFLAPRLDILLPGFRWSPVSVLIGVFLGLVIPVLSALFPVYNGTRVKIIDAITDLGISADYGQGRVTRLIGALPFPIIFKQAIANVYRKRSRLALTGLTLTVTVATFMATIAVAIGLNRELDAIFSRLTYQFNFAPNSLQNPDELEALILEEDQITKVAPASIYFIQVEGDYQNFFTRNNLLQVYGIDPEQGVIDLVYLEGTGWDEDPTRQGIVIAIPISEQLGLEAGDQMSFFIGGQRVTREVIGVDRNGFDQSLMLWDDLAQLAGTVSGAPRPNEYAFLARLEGRTLPVAVVGLDETMLAFLLDEEMNPDDPGVVLSQSLADAQGISVGNTVMITAAGSEGQRRVEAIIPNAVLEGAAAQLPGTGGIPDDIILFGFRDLVSLTGVSLEGEPIPNSYYITIANTDATVADVDAVIEQLNAHLLEAGIPGTFINRVETEVALNEVIAQNISIILSATLLIALVGAIGLLTTLSIAVLERQKEIGVMRSIGAGSSTIASQFLIEGLIVGFIAWVISIPLTNTLAQVLFQVLQQKYIPFTYPPEALVLGLIGILGVSAVASLGPSLNAAGKTVSDILRYQ